MRAAWSRSSAALGSSVRVRGTDHRSHVAIGLLCVAEATMLGTHQEVQSLARALTPASQSSSRRGRGMLRCPLNHGAYA